MSHWQSSKEINQINKDDVHIWVAELTSLTSRIDKYYATLSGEEQQRSQRFIQAHHRERFIISHGFMRYVLASYLPQSPAELSFHTEGNGKPTLISNNETDHLRFNLSHSKDVALLAVCLKNIGADVEYANKQNEWKKIIKRFFTAEEQQALLSLPESDQQRAFFQVWTRKEAHMKVTGKGLRLPPSQFSVSVPPDNAKLNFSSETSKQHRWQMQDIELVDELADYCACISVEGNFSDIEQYKFSG